MKCRACGVVTLCYCADCALLTIKQVAQRFHMSTAKIERLIAAGRIKPVRISYRRVLIRRADVERLLGKN